MGLVLSYQLAHRFHVHTVSDVWWIIHVGLVIIFLEIQIIDDEYVIQTWPKYQWWDRRKQKWLVPPDWYKGDMDHIGKKTKREFGRSIF